MSGPAPGTTSVVPQRLVIVLPTSGAFDSRTYRIATTCARRGHDVTVLARADAGLAGEEHDPAGYRIVRVAVDPIEALPFPTLWRRLRARRWRRAAAPGPTASAATAAMASPVRSSRGRLLERVRVLGRGVWRVAAIALTVRAQARATARVDRGADLYHAMAYMGIPVGLAAAARRRSTPGGDHPPVVYDARDIYLEARNLARLPRPARWLVGRLERRWARHAARVVTTNAAYAEEMRTRLGVPLPLVVMNCSATYRRADPRPRLFHEVLGLPLDRPVVLYHGGLFPERGIEQLIEAWPAVPGAELVLMGYGVLEAELPRRIAASGAADRIHLLPAVPPAQLHDWVASADVAAMPIQPTTLNHQLTTPNKLFEAMAAATPVVASDLPGMAAIVNETGCGVLCDPTRPAAIADAIRAILDAPPEARRAMADRAGHAADEIYNWETQAEALLAEYTRLTGRPW
ncbi:MAG TPA: glycosyltransferase [Candidatus Limnocylindrales bacterium]